MKNIFHPVDLLVLTCCLLNANTGAQQINISLNASEDIIVTATDPGTLNFNEKNYLIETGKVVDVVVSDHTAAVITIDAQSDRNITLTLDAPLHLTLDALNSIPFMARMAYSNLGASSESQARATATQITTGSCSFTIPVLITNSAHTALPAGSGPSGYNAANGRVFLFIYGTLGPVPQNAAAGLYTGEIHIHASYASQ